MTAKDFLSRANHIDLSINSKLEQIKSLRDLAGKAASIRSSYSGARNIHRMDEVVIKILDLESEINASIKNLVDIKYEIMETIALLPTSEYRTLLELRYVCGKSWDDVAAEMTYSVRSIHRLHADALHEFNKIIIS